MSLLQNDFHCTNPGNKFLSKGYLYYIEFMLIMFWTMVKILNTRWTSYTNEYPLKRLLMFNWSLNCYGPCLIENHVKGERPCGLNLPRLTRFSFDCVEKIYLLNCGEPGLSYLDIAENRLDYWDHVQITKYGHCRGINMQLCVIWFLRFLPNTEYGIDGHQLRT